MAQVMVTFSRRELLAFVVAFAAARPAFGQIGRLQTFEKGQLAIQTRRELHKFRVEIARTSAQQAQGLMFRRHLDADAGMLFIYPVARRHSMWMKNTFIPLDMLFIDGSGRVVSIVERTIPGSLEVVSPTVPALAVLELNGGTVSRLRIAVGDKVLYSAFGTAQQ